MAALKERCPNCGGTIILNQSSNIGECNSCGGTYSLSDLHRIKYGSFEEHKETNTSDSNIEELCKKAEIALETEQWQTAGNLSNEILRRNPKHAKAYLYRLLSENKVYKKEELANLDKPFDNSDNYRLLIRFADTYLKMEIEKYSEEVNSAYQTRLLEKQYQGLCTRATVASIPKHYQDLANGFYSLGDYKDSKVLAAEHLQKFKAAHKQARSKVIRKRVFIALVIIGVILAIVCTSAIKKASYRAELFSVEITDKVNIEYTDTNADFIFKFNIINDSKHNANYLKGFITISDSEGNILADGTCWFNGTIAARNTNYFEMSLELDSGGASSEIWDSDISDLIIKYRIIEIRFEDGTTKMYTGKDVIVNKTKSLNPFT